MRNRQTGKCFSHLVCRADNNFSGPSELKWRIELRARCIAISGQAEAAIQFGYRRFFDDVVAERAHIRGNVRKESMGQVVLEPRLIRCLRVRADGSGGEKRGEDNCLEKIDFLRFQKPPAFASFPLPTTLYHPKDRERGS